MNFLLPSLIGFLGTSPGGLEIFVLFAALVLLFGAKSLPGFARQFGRIMEELRRASWDFKRQMMEADYEIRKATEDVHKDFKDLTDLETSKPPYSDEHKGDEHDAYDHDADHADYQQDEYHDDHYHQPDGDDQAAAGDGVAPALDPQTPALDPQEPALDPQTPALDPQEPALDPQTPALDPQTPGLDALHADNDGLHTKHDALPKADKPEPGVEPIVARGTLDVEAPPELAAAEGPESQPHPKLADLAPVKDPPTHG
ncbi:MAG: Sec-independent protein translocase protein TatA [Candidatus Omnitrophota bacterium]|jgi:Sec-independent protein translocase protein TatA